MMVLLVTGIVKVDDVKESGTFLIEIMPLMFIASGVGIVVYWKQLKTMLIPLIIITFVSTVLVMAVSGKVTQYVIKRRKKHEFQFARTIGVVISVMGYELGLLLKRKFKSAIFNPLLISIIFVICCLLLFRVDYDNYNKSAQYLSYLLTPATVCLAIPLYQQIKLLKENVVAIFAGIISGVLTSLVCIFAFALIFNFGHEEYVTLLPKSITTAIGMGISEELGGYVTITVAVIIITGVLGNICGEAVCKIFKITNPVAKGIALGTSSHAIGTAKAMEMGEIEGAMSSLSIVIAGICTMVGASVFANFI